MTSDSGIQNGGVSFIVPVYNSAGTINRLIQGIGEVASSLKMECELILVNDGSIDASWNIIEAASSRYSWIRGINLCRNFGQHNALLCAIRSARFEIIITLDDDLQYPPTEIPKLLRVLQDQNIDVVYGYPSKQEHSFFRNIASLTTKVVLQKAMGANTARNISAFRAFRTKIRKAFAGYQNPYVNIDVLLSWGTNRFAAIVVTHIAREDGKSNYTLAKLVSHAVNMITGFSTLPLQIAMLNGFILIGLGGVLLLYVILRYCIEGSPPGFAFLASIIIVFSGAQLLALGIIGEYVGRIYAGSMDRPPYAVDDWTGTVSSAANVTNPPASDVAYVESRALSQHADLTLKS